MKIAFANDHAGYEVRQALIDFLKGLGHSVTDFGWAQKTSCDYSDFAIPASISVSKGENDFGILLCGSGIGMSIVANRFNNVRAALCWNEEVAKLSRQHNNANILCLPSRVLQLEELKKVISVWLSTSFCNEERHQNRINKIPKGII